jgi:hypothetical protein
MPKLGQGPAGLVKVALSFLGDPPPLRAPVPHSPADHISFLNADGTRSRICICVCDRCWPVQEDGLPGPCPDWNEDV